MKTLIISFLLIASSTCYAQIDVACFMAGADPVQINDVKHLTSLSAAGSYSFTKDDVDYLVPINACIVRSHK